MKTSDIVNKVNLDDAEESMLDRDSSIGGEIDLASNDFDLDDDDDFSDFFDSDDSSDVGSEDFNLLGGNSTNNGGLLGNPLQQQAQQPQQPQHNVEDVIYEASKALAKGSVGYAKELGQSFFGLKARFWTKFGSNLIMVGGTITVVGIPLLFLNTGIAYNFIIGGILDLITGVGSLTFFYDRAKIESDMGVSEIENNPITEDISLEGDEIDLDDDLDEITSSMLDDDEEDLFGDLEDEEDEEDGEEDDIFSRLFEDAEESEDITNNNFEESIEEAEKELDNIDTNIMYTRQYLYEKISPVLENINKEYDNMKTIDSESTEFKSLNHIVSVSGKQLTSSEDDVPYLLSASENMLYIKLDIQRTKAVKSASSITTLCNEIASCLKVDETTGSIPEENEGIYATGMSVADKVIIKVYKGEATMVSVKDIMDKKKDFFLEAKNKIPCVIGIDGDGQPVLRDFKDMESMLMTGFPRSGKTWATLSIITQLAMWNSPRDIQFYICDPKNKISDFKYLTLPHVRGFVYKDSDILAKLRYLVTVEGERRTSIIGDENKVNIWDFKAQNPDIDLPIIYVIIDEVVSLADRMDKDTKKEFQDYLRTLITRLPAVGIRAILVPHEIKHDIINKTTTDSIPCRFSVKGDENHIKQNVTDKKFQHILRNKGDMAVKLPGADVKFIRSAVLSDSNEKNMLIFNFLRKLWSKLEPDYVKGSMAEGVEEDNEVAKMLKDTVEEVNNMEIEEGGTSEEKSADGFDDMEEVNSMDEIDEVDEFFNF